MKKLIIVRHGESVDNVSHTIQGQRPGKLTANGLKQAELLGLRLSKEKFDKIFSSDLARVVNTTAEIIKHHSVEPKYVAELRERAFGEYEGRTLKEYYALSDTADVPYYEVKPPGGESVRELVDRAKSFIDFVKSNCPGEMVLFSAHGSLNRALILSILGWELNQWKTIEQDNTCVNTFHFNEDGTLAEYELNCAAHLGSTRNENAVGE